MVSRPDCIRLVPGDEATLVSDDEIAGIEALDDENNAKARAMIEATEPQAANFDHSPSLRYRSDRLIKATLPNLFR